MLPWKGNTSTIARQYRIRRMVVRLNLGFNQVSQVKDRFMKFVNKPLLDFAWANKKLVGQRQATYAAGTILVAFNLNVALALFCYGICLLSEFYELRLCQKVLETKRINERRAEVFTIQFVISGVLGASSIVFCACIVSVVEGPSIHIGPLFFLMMAALYTAMNTCQLWRVMAARLLTFTLGFLFIPLYDLMIVWSLQRTDLWTQFGISIFVLLFVFECARKFSSHYQTVEAKIEDLRVEKDRLAVAFELQSQFVSTVSHELRTPLTSVKASLDLLTNEKACKNLKDVRRIAELGQRNSNRLVTLVNDLLDFQKFEATGMNLQLKRVDLRDLVKDSVQANQMLGKSRGVNFEVRLPEMPLYVMGDLNRLLQVMANVLSNAVKFSHDGGTVDITAKQEGKRGRISVCDYGIGIPDDAHALVFSPFTQVDGSDKRTYGGTGLGMSISDRIMKSHGGEIDYVSKAGEGTVFTIELDLNTTLAAKNLET